jgi:putative membrane protein
MAIYPIDENERARIRTAIERAESRTAGEIYVVVARQSGDYRLVPIVWALIAALIVPVPLIAFTRFSAGGIYLAELVIFLAVALILSLPDVLPRIVPANLFREHGHARAIEQFLAHGLTNTEARTGVLIFVSLTERYAEIVADTGIAAKVSQQTWDELIARLTAEIATGRLGEGLIGAVERAGAALAEHFPRLPGDRNELVNDVVLL